MDASQSLCHDVPDYAMKKAGTFLPRKNYVACSIPARPAPLTNPT